MEIHPDIQIIDLGLFLAKHNALVFADFHIGYEEALNKQGVLIPRFQFKDIIARLERIFQQVHPETIIINGDIKHEFGTISGQEWRETLKLLDFLKRHCKRCILIRGNHDTILGPIADKQDIEIIDSYTLGGIIILHGHKLQKINSKILIIAHEHPAVSLREGSRTERFKAFLKGKFKDCILIVQPSFNLVTEGSDVSTEKTLSPYLCRNLADFKVFIVADKAYEFGKLGNLD